MSVLVIGVNHRTSPVAMLERLTLVPEELRKAVSARCANSPVARRWCEVLHVQRNDVLVG